MLSGIFVVSVILSEKWTNYRSGIGQQALVSIDTLLTNGHILSAEFQGSLTSWIDRDNHCRLV